MQNIEIKGFFGPWRFLSNFYPCPVVHYGISFLSSEAAYQAAKSFDPKVRRDFCKLTASQAKKLGRIITIRDDWDLVKVNIMKDILKDKFTRTQDLHYQLVSTRDAYLEETNSWGDTFWGVCNGQGQNQLGKLLMDLRTELQPLKF